MKRLKKGFTLIELLVVIAIIGILATTLAPKLREQLAKAKDSKAIAILGAARTAGSVALVDKMVIADSGTVTLIFSDVTKKLDKKSKAMIAANGEINVGGSRTGVDTTLTYGGAVGLTDSLTGSIFATSATAITATGDEIELFLTKGTGAGDYSTEGKKWLDY